MCPSTFSHQLLGYLALEGGWPGAIMRVFPTYAMAWPNRSIWSQLLWWAPSGGVDPSSIKTKLLVCSPWRYSSVLVNHINIQWRHWVGEAGHFTSKLNGFECCPPLQMGWRSSGQQDYGPHIDAWVIQGLLCICASGVPSNWKSMILKALIASS